MSQLRRFVVVVAAVCALSAFSANAATWYVDGSAASSGMGISWPEAFQTIGQALAAAQSGDDIWVAAGTYRPQGSDNYVVWMVDGVALYGGFDGTEVSINERDPKANVTTLDGSTVIIPVDHVVIGVSNARLDGFTVRNGQADGGGNDSNGGGMYNNSCDNLVVANCVFTSNTAVGTGGGVHNTSGSPAFENCRFESNGATGLAGYGGGAYNNATGATYTDCWFLSNWAASQGGGVRNRVGTTNFKNCVFRDNRTTGGSNQGGAVRNYQGSHAFVNCVFDSNTAGAGAAIINYDCTANFVNCTLYGHSASAAVTNQAGVSMTATSCIFWGNTGGGISGGAPTLNYCDYEGGWAGAGTDNIDWDPQFVAPDSGNFQLKGWWGSPCIDRGFGGGVDYSDTDMEGNVRFDYPWSSGGGGTPDYVDMGAYEYMKAPNVPGSYTLFVKPGGTGSGLSWDDPMGHPQEAVNTLFGLWPDFRGVVLVAAGTYDNSYNGGGTNPVLMMDWYVDVYGGCAGTEKSVADVTGRDWRVNSTVLDGQDTAYHVVVGESEARLDGFTIANGNAIGVNPDSRGGGMLNIDCDVMVSNCIFENNFSSEGGGAIYNYGETTTIYPVIEKCEFRNNMVTNMNGGGAVYNRGSMPADMSTEAVISNCLFDGNQVVAPGSNGGAVYTLYAFVEITNSSFYGNSAAGAGSGGGSYSLDSDLTLTNCIFWQNVNGEISYSGDDPDVNFCDVAGGWTGGSGNINSDPNFVDAAGGDLHLQSSSPCINTGTAMQAPDEDLDSSDRPIGGGVDMGAYEYDYAGANDIWYVDVSNASGTYDGTSWATAWNSTSQISGLAAGDEVWFAEGSYDNGGGGSTATVLWMAPGVAYYGGFQGTETERSQRDPDKYVTVLDGDSGIDNANIVVHVGDGSLLDGFSITNGIADGPSTWGGGLYANGDTNVTLVDCVFTKNQASSGGGAIYAAISDGMTIVNCVFDSNQVTGNYGGAIFSSNTSMSVSGCSFLNNSASTGGGAICSNGDSLAVRDSSFEGNSAATYGACYIQNPGQSVVTGCTFRNNEATTGYGGALYMYSTSGTNDFYVESCTFIRNFAASWGGAVGARALTETTSEFVNCVFFDNGMETAGPELTDNGGALNVSHGGGVYTHDATVTNCTFTDNHTDGLAGGIYVSGNASLAVTVTNSILWFNDSNQFYTSGASPSTVDYSSIAQAVGEYTENTPGSNNIIAPPTFFHQPSGNLRLQGGSAGLDAGDNNVAPGFDRAGNDRIYNATVDHGAYEYQGWNPSTWYVREGFCGSGTSWADAMGHIQEAVDAAYAYGNGEVWVAGGTYDNSYNGGGTAGVLELDITYPNPVWIWIYGGLEGNEEWIPWPRTWEEYPTVLDGSGTAGHVVTVDQSAVSITLDGFFITGGNATGAYPDNCGGGIYVDGSTGNQFNMYNCAVHDNHADYAGGGMYTLDLSPNIYDCRFEDNEALDGTNNTYGGGIELAGTPPWNIWIERCVFSGNYAYRTGGGLSVWVAVGAPVINMRNCLFCGNESVGAGSALQNAANDNEFYHCTFAGNVTGSAVDVLAGSPVFNGCIFWNEGIAEITGIGPEVYYSCIEGGWGGTGSDNIAADPLLVGSAAGNCRLRANSPCIDTGDPVGLVWDDIEMYQRPVGPYTDMGCYEFHTGVPPVGTIWYVKIGGDGDGSSWERAFGHPAQADAVMQPADEVWVAEGVYYPALSGFVIDVSNGGDAADGNVAYYGGFAGCEEQRKQRDPKRYETILDGESNGSHVVNVAADYVTVDGFTITNGYASVGSGTDTYGGGLCIDGNSYLLVQNCTFRNNEALDSGGAMCMRSASDVTVLDCTFESNFAGINEPWGGAIWASNAVFSVSGCVFNSNESVSFSSGCGGAIYTEGNIGSADVFHNVFDWNYSDGAGGAIYGGGTVVAVSNCTFNTNTAETDGAGICCELGGTLTVSNSTFDGNQAGNDGGGIYADGVAVASSMSHCLFYGNGTSPIAGDDGGGVYLANCSPPLSNCVFDGNYARDQGGGIAAQGAGTSPVLVNCLFSGNAAGAGGAVNAEAGATASLVNCTASGNAATNGDCISCDGAGTQVTVVNSILWNGGDEIFLNNGGAATVSYSDVAGGYAGTNNFDADPQFVDQIGGDFHLTAGSECIDAANSGAGWYPTTDIEGSARWDDPGMDNIGAGPITWADVGAYEFQGTTAPSMTVTSPTAGDTWDAGSTHDITWTTYGRVSSVDLFVSHDGGGSYSWIVGVANTGTYSWDVIGPGSTNCLILVQDAVDGWPFGLSGTFTIADIQVTTPNGGELWNSGFSYAVTWNSVGSIGPVDIAYSLDGGSTWDDVVTGAADTGIYTWDIPPMAGSTTCRVRVQGSGDALPTDVSDGDFTIAGIEVTSPNGGETWMLATNRDITWTSVGVANVMIELHRNGSWETLVLSTPSTGTYTWLVAGATASDCSIRVSTAGLPGPSDQSDADFSIVDAIWLVDINSAAPVPDGITWDTAFRHPQDAVDVASGGQEIWIADGTYNRRGGADTVLLALIDDIGVYGGFDGIGTYETSRNERDTAANPTILDGNGSVWHVVTGANDVIFAGFIVTDGLADGAGVDDVRGAGMFNDSCSNLTLVDCVFEANGSNGDGAGMYNRNSSLALIDCTFRSNLSNGSGGGMANVNGGSALLANCVFHANTAVSRGGAMRGSSCLLALLNCTFYNNTAGIEGGALANTDGGSVGVANCILWGDNAPSDPEIHTDGLSSSSVTYSDIAQSGGYDDDGGNFDEDPAFVDSVAGDLHLSAGSFCIDAGDGDMAPAQDMDGNGRPDDPGMDDTGTGTPTYTDVGAYEFQGTSTPVITITAPNGGEVWNIGSTEDITWTTSGGRVLNVLIQLSRDNGASWQTIVMSTSNTGTYSLPVAAPGSEECLVRVADVDDGDPVDESDAVFAMAIITVTRPNGGEIFGGDTEETITWDCTGIAGKVEILYSTDSGATFPIIIASVTASTGAYAWSVPDIDSTTVRVRVQEEGGGVMDDSDADFTIASTWVKVISPNGGETWAVGDEYDIIWDSAKLANVHIELSRDEGTSWEDIIDSTDAAAGRYTWTVTGAVSDTCLVRVSDEADGDPASVSDAVFSVVAAWVQVDSPAGGELWVVGEAYDITWSAQGMTEVHIELSRDNGTTWEDIIDSTASGVGRYCWEVTDGALPLPQDQCLIKVSDASDGNPSDVCDATFRIIEVGNIIRVDCDAVGAPDGSTWATAFPTIQAAMAVASAGDEIWVAEGTYYRQGADTVLLTMIPGVRVYGGFGGNETSRDERCVEEHEAVLDGGSAVTHVVVGASNVILDGLTITGGAAGGAAAPDNSGGGMYNPPGSAGVSVKDCYFVANSAGGFGGAMFNEGASVTVEYCAFDGNTAGVDGGAVYNWDGASFDCSRSEFTDNVAFGSGGAVAGRGSCSAAFRNSLFTGNTAGLEGGVGCASGTDCSLSLVNCTSYANQAGVAGGALAVEDDASLSVVNSILWADTAPSSAEVYDNGGSVDVTYSDVFGGYAGVGNIAAAPLFVDPDAGDFTLRDGSPCIDAADGHLAPSTDMNDNGRENDPDVKDTGTGTPAYADMGALEHHPTPGAGKLRIGVLGGGCAAGDAAGGAGWLIMALAAAFIAFAARRCVTRGDG